eukprot:3900423-Pyramimonas_sp.AAC.1
MTPAQVDAMITGTWGKAMGKMRTMTLTLYDARASPGRRAAAWNACVAPLSPIQPTTCPRPNTRE